MLGDHILYYNYNKLACAGPGTTCNANSYAWVELASYIRANCDFANVLQGQELAISRMCDAHGLRARNEFERAEHGRICAQARACRHVFLVMSRQLVPGATGLQGSAAGGHWYATYWRCYNLCTIPVLVVQGQIRSGRYLRTCTIMNNKPTQTNTPCWRCVCEGQM